MNTLAKGQWAEAMALAWLLEQGYEVFMAHGNTSCDMLAMREGKVERVEVKYGAVKDDATGTGKLIQLSPADPAKYDLLLVIRGDTGQPMVNPPIGRGFRRLPS